MAANRSTKIRLRSWIWAACFSIVAFFSLSAQAENVFAGGKFTYRGFTVDATAARSGAKTRALEASVKHQLDIVADSGVKPEILDFFRNQVIVLKSGLGSDHGRFDGNIVMIEDTVEPPQRPIILHELLHAYHAKVLPEGGQNPDVLLFYNRAKNNNLYPSDEYLLKNNREFFAVTASLYLWGNVDREPHTRENLKAKQPIYYDWLGKLFSVSK
jgi:hypothetical protein